MTKNNKKILLTITVMFVIMMLPILASAQIEDVPSNPEAEVPIDGVLSLLVAAGVGYGAKKIKERKTFTSSNKNYHAFCKLC